MDDINRRIKAYQRMRGVGPPSRAWEARVIAVIRHPQSDNRIAPISRLSQDAKFFYRKYCNKILQGQCTAFGLYLYPSTSTGGNCLILGHL